MLLGLYKLSGFNKYFRLSFFASAVFLAFSLGELGVAFYEMFFAKINSPTLISVMSAVRSLIIGVLTVMMLKALSAISKEVDIPELVKKCDKLTLATAILYGSLMILELPLTFIDPYVLAICSLIAILSAIVIIILNLSAIYSCYMKICMPGDEELKDKPSRFAFVNEYRERKAEKAKQEAEKRLEELKRRKAKRGNKK
jgi:type IV secretory pathway VirB6-like protein